MTFIKVVPGFASGSFSSVSRSITASPGESGAPGSDPLTAMLSAMSTEAEAEAAASRAAAVEEQTLAGRTGFQNVISYGTTDDGGAQRLSNPDSGGTTTI